MCWVDRERSPSRKRAQHSTKKGVCVYGGGRQGGVLGGEQGEEGQRQGHPRKLCLGTNKGRRPGVRATEIMQKMQAGAIFQGRQSSQGLLL